MTPSLTARLFVTDVGILPLRGETRVEQAANYLTDQREARAERLVSIWLRFKGRVRRHLPAKADERFVAAVQSEIARMVSEGDLHAGRMGEMLASVRRAEGGKVTVAIVDLWGTEVDL